MSLETHKAVVRRYFELVSGNRLDELAEIVAEDLIDHTAYPGQPPGRAGLVAFFASFREAFPDFTLSVEDVFGEGDRVAARFVFRGTHQGELMGIAPSGVVAEMGGIDLFRLKDGKIVELWGREDVFGLMQQLGAIPAAA